MPILSFPQNFPTPPGNSTPLQLSTGEQTDFVPLTFNFLIHYVKISMLQYTEFFLFVSCIYIQREHNLISRDLRARVNNHRPANMGG